MEKGLTRLKYGEKHEKVLACITPQSNSRRLIDSAYEIARSIDGELHILHVETGGDLFVTSGSASLLQDLFNHGSELGGVVHAVCANEVIEAIIKFIKSEKITHVLLGRPPEHAEVRSIDAYTRLTTVMPHLAITVLDREPE